MTEADGDAGGPVEGRTDSEPLQQTPPPAGSSVQMTETTTVGSCPALGLLDDRSAHFLEASRSHRCYAAQVVRAIPLDHQVSFCLTPEYSHCPLWTGAPVPRAAAAAVMERSRRQQRRGSVLGLSRRAVVAAATVLGVLVLTGAVLAIARGRGTGNSVTPVVARPAVATRQPTPAAAARTVVATPPPPAAASLGDDKLLRPGAVLVKRVNVDVPGSASGAIAIVSRVETAGSCNPWFLDVYAYDATAGKFVDVFDGASSARGVTPVIPQPAATAGGCIPIVSLLGAKQLEGGQAPLLFATISQQEGKLRVLAITVPKQGSERSTLAYDTTFDKGGSVRLTDNPARLEITSNAFAGAVPGISTADSDPVGTVVQSLSAGNSGLVIASQNLRLACKSGAIAALSLTGAERYLRLRCDANGATASTVYRLAPDVQLQPAAATVFGLRIGDPVDVTMDVAGLNKVDPLKAVATAAAIRLRGDASLRFGVDDPTFLATTAAASAFSAAPASAPPQSVAPAALAPQAAIVPQPQPIQSQPVVIAPRPIVPAATAAPDPATPQPDQTTPVPATPEPTVLPTAAPATPQPVRTTPLPAAPRATAPPTTAPGAGLAPPPPASATASAPTPPVATAVPIAPATPQPVPSPTGGTGTGAAPLPVPDR